MMYNFNFDFFNPLYGDCHILPSNTLIYRCFDIGFPVISKKSSFFGSQKVAEIYGLLPNRNCAIFKTTRNLRLIDIRYMKVILSEYIKHTKIRTEIQTGIIKTIILGLGLCSFKRQIELYKERYKINEILIKDIQLQTDKEKDTLKRLNTMENALKKYNDIKYLPNKPININPIEFEGVRIGETNNDSILLEILTEIFKDYCDGFISPILFSPYHYEKYYNQSEIALFIPNKCDLEITNLDFNDNIYKKTIKFNDFITYQNHNIRKFSFTYEDLNATLFQKQLGGKTDIYNDIEIFNKNNEIEKINNKTRNNIRKITKQLFNKLKLY